VVADNSGSGATKSTRIEDSGRNPQIIPGQKSASGPDQPQVPSNPRLSFTARMCGVSRGEQGWIRALI
jgi:hypothetical protein